MAGAMQFSESFSPLQYSVTASCSCTAASTSGNSSVKIGGLWKRSQGLSRFTKHNYKHRVFILTDQTLSYYGGTVDRVGQCKGRVQLEKVRAVEFVDVAALNLAHAMQVVYHSKKSGFTTLYIIASTKEECVDWVVTLRQMCYFNRDMLMHYHPGALLKSKWSCCRQRGLATLGCQPTYDLLTRSSSRYAQIRRKDTLTDLQKLIRQDSRLHDRRSGATVTDVDDGTSSTLLDHGSVATSFDIEDDTGREDSVEVIDGMGSLPPKQSLSNSCGELSSYTTHSRELFGPTGCSTPSTTSPRSSRNSNDQSVGLGSMLLTRVSMMTASDGVEEERIKGEDVLELDQQMESFLYSTPKSSVVSRGKLGRRSQIAPAWINSSGSGASMPCGSASPKRHSYVFEHKTLPRSFKTSAVKRREGSGKREMDLPIRSPGRGKGDLKGEQDLAHVGSPRAKKGTGGYATQYTPSTIITPITEHSRRVRPMSSIVSSAMPPLKHTKTITIQGKNLPPSSTLFSQSMKALSKPLIEPKISLSNPNIIHV